MEILKKKTNIFMSMCIDDIMPVCLKFTFDAKRTNFNCHETKVDDNFTRMLRLCSTMICKYLSMGLE